MKKIVKIFTLIFIFIAIANSSFATVTGTLSVTSDSSIKDILPLIIGSALICAVLFLGYRWDNSDKESFVQNVKPDKKTNQKMEEITEKEEAEIYNTQNKRDIPYEEDRESFFEYDNDLKNEKLSEDEEYEEDDISLFMLNEENESSFENIDDDISFDENVKYKNDNDDIYSTMVFDSNEVNDKLDFEEDDVEYTEAVQGLEEKIDQLDELDGFTIETNSKEAAESFMEGLKKYEPNADEDIESFTTGQKETFDEIKKTNTNKKEKVVSAQDINFLEIMEENLKKDQETRQKKSTKKTTTKKTIKKKE